jgi:hypothetical protein
LPADYKNKKKLFLQGKLHNFSFFFFVVSNNLRTFVAAFVADAHE